MLPWFALFFVGFVTSLLVTKTVRRIAIAADVLDETDQFRKVHATPVPRLGGVGIAAGVYGALLVGAFLDPALRGDVLAHPGALGALAAGGAVIAGLGVYDDLRGANAHEKFAVQSAVAMVLYGCGFRILAVENPFGPDIALGWLSLPLTLLWIVGVMNAVNLIDGLDGLAGGIAVPAMAALALISAQAGNTAAIPIAIAAIGAVLGFLVFNLSPASIFMGDTGSLFLGLVLSVLAVAPGGGARATPLVAMVVVLAIPIADTLLAIARRFARGASPFHADRKHLHHRLLDGGRSQRQAVTKLWAAAGLLAVAGRHVALPAAHAVTKALVLALVIVGGALALREAGMFDFADDAIRARGRRRRAGSGASVTPAGQLGTPRVDVLGYAVASAAVDAYIESVVRWIHDGTRCRWVACINPHSYAVARSDARFRAALRSADALLPDGAGIVLASRLLRRPVAGRVTGSDLFRAVMEAVDRRGGTRVFFLGASEETLAIIRDKVRAEFPGAIVAGTYSPPFTPELTAAESAAMVAAINAASADVLWVAMTAPKQEVWLHQNLDRLEVKVAGAIGAAFDFYAGRVKRSSPVFQRLGLEWLPRLLREPRRLWKRTFVSAPIFLWDTARAMIAERASSRERARSGAAGPTRGRASASAEPGPQPERDVRVEPVKWPERAGMTEGERPPLP